MDRRRKAGRKAWRPHDGAPRRGGDRPGGAAREDRRREGRPHGGDRPQRRGPPAERPRYGAPREDRPRYGERRGDGPRRDRPYGDRRREGGGPFKGRPQGDRPRGGPAGRTGPRQDGPSQEGPRRSGPRHDLPWQDRPRQDRAQQDRPRYDRPRQQGPREGGWRPRQEGPRAAPAWRERTPPTAPPGPGPQAIRARGRAGELGLDGHLRVALEPIDMSLAEQLTSKGGAPVIQARGDRVGRVLVIVGTLQRPVAIVELDRAAREGALALRGREVHIT